MRRQRIRGFRYKRRSWFDRLRSFGSNISATICGCCKRYPLDEEWNESDQDSRSNEEIIDIDDDPRHLRQPRARVAPELELDIGPPQPQTRTLHDPDRTVSKVHLIPTYGSITTIFTYVDTQIIRAKTLQPPQQFVRITFTDIRQAVGYSPPPPWIDTGVEAAARKHQALIIKEQLTSDLILDWRVESFDELSQHLNQPLGAQGA